MRFSENLNKFYLIQVVLSSLLIITERLLRGTCNRELVKVTEDLVKEVPCWVNSIKICKAYYNRVKRKNCNFQFSQDWSQERQNMSQLLQPCPNQVKSNKMGQTIPRMPSKESGQPSFAILLLRHSIIIIIIAVASSL